MTRVSYSVNSLEILDSRFGVLSQPSARWSIWPFVPALIVVFIGGGLYDDRPGKLWRYGASAVVAIVGTALGLIHYRHKGEQFQRELDALADMGES